MIETIQEWVNKEKKKKVESKVVGETYLVIAETMAKLY